MPLTYHDHEHIKNMLKKKPCTVNDLSNAFDLKYNDVANYIKRLIIKKVGIVKQSGETPGQMQYYLSPAAKREELAAKNQWLAQNIPSHELYFPAGIVLMRQYACTNP